MGVYVIRLINFTNSYLLLTTGHFGHQELPLGTSSRMVSVEENEASRGFIDVTTKEVRQGHLAGPIDDEDL